MGWAGPRRAPRSAGHFHRAALLGLAAACLTLASLVPSSLAKQKKPPTKTIQGEVLDQADNPIVGAAVQLTDTTTGKTLGIYSQAGGRYRFTDLRPIDDYQVQATYKGQQSEVRRASSLDDRAIVVLNLSIPPAESKE